MPPAADPVAAATSLAASLGLEARECRVLSASSTTVVRLLPCDAVARVSPAARDTTAALEVDLALQLERLGAPIVPLDPRVPQRPHLRGGFVTTFWTHCSTAGAPPVSREGCAESLARLHRALREVTVAVPHVTDRLQRASRLLARPDLTPRLAPADRALLQAVLGVDGDRLRGAAHEQVLHGEPHPGNALATPGGAVFIDWETSCRGPVEFDLAHAPAGVEEVYPGADPDLLASCRRLALAVATAWRYDVEDRLPDGLALGAAWLEQLRAGPGGT
ncbi:MAG: aminoglycoside phosphotransferase family protein [Quadrisphaera sp.]